MVRKLLKRKLKILSTKKLKTSSHRKSSLAHWAIKQLLKIQKNTFLIRYPSPAVARAVSDPIRSQHHKELLNRLINGSIFLHFVNQEWSNKNNLEILLRKHPVVAFGAQGKHSGDLYKTQTTDTSGNPQGDVSNASVAKNPIICSENRKQGGWPTLKLRPKTIWDQFGKKEKQNTLVRSHWKNIYSLDQLLCHQFDAQFRRAQTAYKAKLTEVRKCNALYGKLPRKQRFRIIKLAKKNNSALNWDNIPLLMESRLGMAVKQCFVFKTIAGAHHWISQGKIMVNHKVIKSPSHLLKPGDLITIKKDSQVEYKQQMRTLFNGEPRERKFVQSGSLVSRWKRWALLFNYLRTKYYLPTRGSEIKTKAATPQYTNQCSTIFPKLPPVTSLKEYKVKREPDRKNGKNRTGGTFLIKNINSPKYPWPDKGIQCFWYATGRSPINCFTKFAFHGKFGMSVQNKFPKNFRVHQWLARHRWPNPGRRMYNWKSIYRRRIFVFSQWLLSQNALINDGLYYCRWKKALVRKKSDWIKRKHKLLSLQKPLHFEVSYKKLCALFLYPPQKLLLPTAIDFKKL